MDSDSLEVDVAACRGRQARLIEELRQAKLDVAVVTKPESVQWLTGAYVGPLFAPAAVLETNGKLTLVLPSRKTSLVVAADEVLPYEEKWHSTTRDDQRAISNLALISALPTALARVGGEWSYLSPVLQAHFGGEVSNLEPVLFRLRRRKDADEIRMLQRANQANAAMYARAREIVRPGINELDLYIQLHSVAVGVLGEPLTYFGQDFRSNARGGPPRDRPAEAGELYILDLGVGFRGYYSDNARTLAVGGEPTVEQRRAWEAIVEVLSFVEHAVKPGVGCRKVFEEAQTMLDAYHPWLFNHHLGHGVGLAPQEGPHLNPHWDDVFAEGDFFTAEPGLYHEDLRHGIRLEENYLVTANGVEKLTDYPLELEQ